MGRYIEIDISDVKDTIDALRAVHTKPEFEKLIYRVFARTGKHVRTIVAKDVVKQYHVTQKTVKSHIGSPRTTLGGGGLGVNCCIPIDGERLKIGGGFGAAGGRHGWKGVKSGKRYKINAQIVKSNRSTLPAEMKHQGGQPPFRNYSAPQLNRIAFTRTSKDPDAKIVPVVGIAVPQMPMNRAKEEVQQDILNTIKKRLEAEHNNLIRKCR